MAKFSKKNQHCVKAAGVVSEAGKKVSTAKWVFKDKFRNQVKITHTLHQIKALGLSKH